MERVDRAGGRYLVVSVTTAGRDIGSWTDGRWQRSVAQCSTVWCRRRRDAGSVQAQADSKAEIRDKNRGDMSKWAISTGCIVGSVESGQVASRTMVQCDALCRKRGRSFGCFQMWWSCVTSTKLGLGKIRWAELGLQYTLLLPMCGRGPESWSWPRVLHSHTQGRSRCSVGQKDHLPFVPRPVSYHRQPQPTAARYPPTIR